MNSEEVRECPVCQSTTFGKTFNCTDHTATGEVFHVKHCLHCGLGITSPRPIQSAASRYYQSPEYISHKATSTGVFDSIYLIIRRLAVRWKYSLVKPFLRDGGLLDYGCGTGSFLAEVLRHRDKAFGVEPSDEARRNAPKGIAIFPDLGGLPIQTFDVITLWHVLEHVYSLRQTLRSLKDKLTPNGALLIAVPNHLSADAVHYHTHWAAYDVPRHLWHFSQQSMATFLHSEGLRLVNVIPMKLDAYYVSLLSERYMNSRSAAVFRVMRALWVAWRSNLSARSQKNYSSLIFVVQK